MFAADRRLRDRRTTDRRAYGALATSSRDVSAPGGYVYRQFSDGSIAIVSGPANVGRNYPHGNAVNSAITTQIGNFPGASGTSTDADINAMINFRRPGTSYQIEDLDTPDVLPAKKGFKAELQSIRKALSHPLGNRSGVEQQAWARSTPDVDTARQSLKQARQARRAAAKDAKAAAKLEQMGAIVAEQMFGPW